jgi:hypothetical protein
MAERVGGSMSRRKAFHSIAWSIGLGWILGGVVLAAVAISVSERSGRYQVDQADLLVLPRWIEPFAWCRRRL